MKHFKERIDKIFPHCRPYSCPNTECGFEGKDKQALLRHYTGKHGVLELYLREALQARGINYHLSDSAKRKSMGNQNNIDGTKAKMARMSPPLETMSLPPSPYQEEPMLADTTTILPNEYSEQIIYNQPLPTRLPTMPTTKLPSMSTVFTRTKPTQSEVDAMIASFEPSEYQISATVFHPQPVVSSQSQSEQPIGSHIVSSTTLDLPTLFLPISSDESSKLMLDNNIMWGSGNSSYSVESNQTVPVQYLETSESGFVNLGDIDYDYLYPATVDPCAVQAHSNSISSIASQTILPFTDL